MCLSTSLKHCYCAACLHGLPSFRGCSVQTCEQGWAHALWDA